MAVEVVTGNESVSSSHSILLYTEHLFIALAIYSLLFSSSGKLKIGYKTLWEAHLELLDGELLIGAVYLIDGLFGSGANPPPPL